jgi:hypothetical protein
MTQKEIIYYKLEGHDEILSSPSWCLEGTVQEDKFRLGLSPYAEYKEIKDYAPTNPYPELATFISDVCNSTKPTVVPKKSRKAKTESQATELSDVQHILDESDPTPTNEEYLRDRTDRPTHPLSTSMDK